jgi:hypothetical protein
LALGLLLLLLQVLNVQLQSEVKRMAALAGVAGQERLPHQDSAAEAAAEQVRRLTAADARPFAPSVRRLYVCASYV